MTTNQSSAAGSGSADEAVTEPLRISDPVSFDYRELVNAIRRFDAQEKAVIHCRHMITSWGERLRQAGLEGLIYSLETDLWNHQVTERHVENLRSAAMDLFPDEFAN